MKYKLLFLWSRFVYPKLLLLIGCVLFSTQINGCTKPEVQVLSSDEQIRLGEIVKSTTEQIVLELPEVQWSQRDIQNVELLGLSSLQNKLVIGDSRLEPIDKSGFLIFDGTTTDISVAYTTLKSLEGTVLVNKTVTNQQGKYGYFTNNKILIKCKDGIIIPQTIWLLD